MSARKVDAVIMSAGINDLFFGAIMGFCTTYDTALSPGLNPERWEAESAACQPPP